jgi:hypothetical protein
LTLVQACLVALDEAEQIDIGVLREINKALDDKRDEEEAMQEIEKAIDDRMNEHENEWFGFAEEVKNRFEALDCESRTRWVCLRES